MKLRPNIRIWLSTDDGRNIIGGGRARLLRTVKDLGSLTAAAQKLNVSYRKAWDDLKKAEKSLGTRLIIKSRGGSGGGKTELTADGLRLLELYEHVTAEAEQFTDETFDRLASEIKKAQET